MRGAAGRRLLLARPRGLGGREARAVRVDRRRARRVVALRRRDHAVAVCLDQCGAHLGAGLALRRVGRRRERRRRAQRGGRDGGRRGEKATRIHRKLHKGDGIGGAKRGGFACR
ncbi:hypothetical protein BURPSS13_P0119 [Burkholderia pseudomallei S13]|nr:hypothetical protein BURPSS13_P0119 [Burkholderia pseudomallei S13]